MRFVEGAPRGWAPPHCPNRKCRYHKEIDGAWRWRKRGFYRRKSDHRAVQRLECGTCAVTFSTQTFSTTYWQKRPDVFFRLLNKTSGCMANRQIARELGVSEGTVNHQLARLGRHSMLFHLSIWQQAPPHGPVCVDGFESFEYSQYHPIHHHVAVDSESGLFLYHADSELRRKGRMTAQQKRRRAALEERLGRPSPRAIERDMAHVLETVLARTTKAIVRSDNHRAYSLGMRGLRCELRHEVTSSRKARTPQNPLFPINALDMLIRHSQSNHRRETISFSKRRQASAERLSVFLVWANYIKPYRVKDPPVTAAMRAGLCNRPLTIPDICSHRLFPERIRLPRRWQEYYDRAITTREFPRNRRHELKYAY